MNSFLKNMAVTLTLFLLASCSSSNDPVQEAVVVPEEVVPEVVMPEELAAEVVECPATVAEGETRTFNDRNEAVDYIIYCDFVVNGDFVIDPDVTIQFGSGAGVTVYGSIQATGTDEKPITFTGEDKVAGSWKGIFIQSDDVSNALVNTQIDYAGGGAFNSNGDLGSVIVYSNTRLNMSNSTISNSAAYGFNASYGGDELVLENNTITTSDAPMIMAGAYPTAIAGGSYTGNTLDAIIVTGDQITGEHIWSRLDVPYHLTEGMSVIPGGKLTIDAGAVLEFGLDAELYINEGASGPKPSLIAVGTEQDPILFTGINKVPGSWNGIRFDTPSVLNEIGFATVEYASSTNLSGAIYMWYGTVLNAHDITFRDIKFCAFTTEATPNLSQSNIEYINVDTQFCDL